MFKNYMSLPEESGIYYIKNLQNDHFYIGQSKNIKKRFVAHHNSEYNNPHSSMYHTQLYKAIRKYGTENFEVGVLQLCCPSQLDILEQYWIEKFNTYKNGYNMTIGGKSVVKHDKRTIEKIRRTIVNNKALQGEKHPRAKLSDSEVINIRQRYKNGESCTSIYNDYLYLGYSLASFKRIIFGHAYKYIGNVPKPNEIRYTNKNRTIGKLPPQTIRDIRCEYAKGTCCYKDLACKYQISIGTIGKIINRQLYAQIL